MLEKLVDEKILPELCRKTAEYLTFRQDELSEIRWSINESNIDEGFSKIAKQCCEKAFGDQEIPKEVKLSVNIPDLLLEFSAQGENVVRKIELKSGKINFKGSAILKLDINQWTILCRRGRPGTNCEIRYGRYHLGIAMTERETFQDRSPRPTPHFQNYQMPDESPKMATKKKAEDIWNVYAQAALRRVLSPGTESWQDLLVKELVREVLRDPEKFRRLVRGDSES
jgi:hypothetical protein